MRQSRFSLMLVGTAFALIGVGATGAINVDLDGPRWAPVVPGAADDLLTTPDAARSGSVVFSVPTITCPSCPLRVEASVKKAPGILDVAFDGQLVTVSYDPSAVGPDAIEAAIEAGGDIAESVVG